MGALPMGALLLGVLLMGVQFCIADRRIADGRIADGLIGIDDWQCDSAGWAEREPDGAERAGVAMRGRLAGARAKSELTTQQRGCRQRSFSRAFGVGRKL